MSTAARGSDEQQCNEQVDRSVKLRAEFGQWWRPWAQLRQCDNAWIREVAWVAWQAGRDAGGEAE